MLLCFSINSCTFTLAPASAEDTNPFTIGVWMQNPTQLRDGKFIIDSYKAIGINTFVGLWNWPTELDPTWTTRTAAALKNAGMRVYAGDSVVSVNWIQAHPEYSSTFVGYMLGDEPDMNRVSGIPEIAAASQPDAWQAAGDLVKAADPSRQRYANFGKGFALYPWAGFAHDGGAAGYLVDIGKYVEPTTVISSDFYAITDPYERLDQHGIWGYGRAVENTKLLAGDRPVWGFVEASSPFPDGKVPNNIAGRMPPSMIMPAIWNMIVHGARGIVYFCHDFWDGPGRDAGLNYDGCLAIPEMIEAMRIADASVSKYGSILISDEPATVTLSIESKVPVTGIVKKHGGSIYLFVMGDGNSYYPNGMATDAIITVKGMEATSTYVEVPEEHTYVYMERGIIRTHFEPYQLRVFKF